MINTIDFYPIYDRVEMCVKGELVDISIEIDATTAEEAMFALQRALKVIRERSA